jgi:hypothetical protein
MLTAEKVIKEIYLLSTEEREKVVRHIICNRTIKIRTKMRRKGNTLLY